MTWATIPELVQWAADTFGDAEALVDGDVRLSWRELAAEVDRTAASVVAAGLQPGERAGIWAPNVREWIFAALGVLAAGGVVVPINTRFKGDEAAYVLRTARARLLFTIKGFLDTDYPAMLAGEDLPDLERTVVFRDPSWDEFRAQQADVDVKVGADDVSDIIFTSGTTGRPKGVVTTHGQTLRVFDAWASIVGLRAGDRYLIVNPFFHTFGFKAGFLACLMKGATIVPEPVFDASRVLHRIAEERISMLPGPPTLHQAILDHPDRDKVDLSSLRLCVTGAAAIPVELIRRLREELTYENIVTAYGLTESTGVVSICRPGDDDETIATTSGCAIPDTEIRIAESGEILVRGYNVMRGYFENPAATAEAIDAEGWLHTGDIGSLDARGYLKITDRLKDMFIVGGFNAYPAEIENTLLGHPDVRQVAVVGAPDERLGEVGVAFVVGDVDGDELIAWARERMANYKVPRRVIRVDALPLNASGKVLKHELRKEI
ncbi:MAG TPA: FadD3 family acyl-CoA ligase [Acidimicrobiales bacterium]|nr:FadD3 family acyl-CoA ligase [Acidimicrobiales bacterium]